MRTRYHDWRPRLEHFLQGTVGKEFAWGAWDCVQFAAGAVEAITGVRLTAETAYADRAAGAALLAVWPDGLAGRVSAALGAPLATPLLAQSGDIVLHETPEGPGLGVVDLDGTHVVVLRPTGAARLRLTQATAAWRV